MGLTNVTCTVEWAPPNGAWTDISGDVLDCEAILESLDQGLPNFKITVDNTAGKHNSDWPAFSPVERGLYYFAKITFGNAKVLVGRFEGIDPSLHGGHAIELDGLIVGGVLLGKNYSAFNWVDKKWDDAVKDIIDWLDKYRRVIVYSSASIGGSTINMQPTDDYCADLIRKFCESEGLTGCLRPDNNDAKVVLDMFPKSEAAIGTKKHTTIFKHILPDSSNLIKSGNVPRDLKESSNILNLTGGKSERAPVDGDLWTERLSGWHKDTSNFELSLDGSLVCNTFAANAVPEGEVLSTKSIKAKPFSSSTLPFVSGRVEFHVNFPEILTGEPYDAVVRKAALINFRWTIGEIGFPTGNWKYTSRDPSKSTVTRFYRPQPHRLSCWT